MTTYDSTETQWGKLTSLNPDSKNLSLSKTPSVFTASYGIVEISMSGNFSDEFQCQIYPDNGDFFVSLTGSGLCVSIEDQIVREGQSTKISSGEKITFSSRDQDGIQLEYIFSSELIPAQKSNLKRDREVNEEFMVFEKQTKFYEVMEDETKCGICRKMIYECASVIPCLHRFCVECLLRHLKGSQTCPQCGVKCLEFRKDTFFHNIIEAYEEEIGYRKERAEVERIFARFEYPKGEVYEGEWKKFRKDGKGKFLSNSRDIYEGDWRNNKKEGQGKMIYSNGDVYEGDWKYNMLNGKGKMIYPNGDVYEGDWKNDMAEGQGKVIWRSGEIYEGDWKNNNIEGKGKLIYSYGSVYEGDWGNNMRQGQGKLILSHGDVYEGDWKDNMLNGRGKMTYPNGTAYEGDWKDNMLNGKGKMTYPNGDMYEGDWKNSRKEGKGKMMLSNGDFYEGDWKNSRKEGKGKMIYKNGNVYVGDWKNDMAEGKGKMMLSNGDFYEGDWKNNKKDGQGKMIYKNGNVYEGDWKNDRRNGIGRLLKPNGSMLDGRWNDDYPFFFFIFLCFVLLFFSLGNYYRSIRQSSMD